MVRCYDFTDNRVCFARYRDDRAARGRAVHGSKDRRDFEGASSLLVKDDAGARTRGTRNFEEGVTWRVLPS